MTIEWNTIAKLFLKPNRADIFMVDLSTARTSESLSKSGTSLTVIGKGTGTWTLTFVFDDETTTDLTSANAVKGIQIECAFTDLQFTNIPQATATAPVFYRDWRA